jgi:hypothetical protein
MGKKECSSCHEWLDVSCFWQKKNTSNHYASECKDCKYGRDLLKTFGISFADYNKLLHAQNGVCALCGKIDPGKRLVVDHNHETEEIRGLLCNRCNMALGVFENCIKDVIKITDYLKADGTVIVECNAHAKAIPHIPRVRA